MKLIPTKNLPFDTLAETQKELLTLLLTNPISDLAKIFNVGYAIPYQRMAKIRKKLNEKEDAVILSSWYEYLRERQETDLEEVLIRKTRNKRTVIVVSKDPLEIERRRGFLPAVDDRDLENYLPPGAREIDGFKVREEAFATIVAQISDDDFYECDLPNTCLPGEQKYLGKVGYFRY